MELTAKRRLSTDARREQLLASGVRLLRSAPTTRSRSRRSPARRASPRACSTTTSRPRSDFLIAAIERGQDELAELTAPDPDLPATEQLGASLERFLDFVEEHAAAYSAIFRSRGGGDPEIQAALEAGRRQRMDAVIESLASWEAAPANVERTPILETAIQGWFFFIEGAVLRWLEHRDLERDELRELLGLALIGALQAAATAGEAAS